ncbi:co-chaperone GroES [Candidatus Fermentibacteria bacterium]|nr:MAG: co-chaperone GroES [Candidatus Fermentibacteria bacterium]
MAEVKVTPLFDRIIIRREEPKEVVQGGIVLPDTAKEKPLEGTIIAVGKGKRTDTGDFIAPVVKEGDKILIGKYSGTEVKVNGEDLVIIREDDILAVIE